ncbi:hypothetical protein RBB50_005960 [Rhinocladiella similis]
MVSFQIVQQSNAGIASLPQGLVALFIGATSGIGQSALEHFARHASAPRIYTVARPAAVTSHEALITSLRQANATGTYNIVTADVSLVSEVDRVVDIIKQKETKLDILVMSAGFMAFEGRKNTSEGLDPSMSTRYYSRLRAVQQLLPLLNNDAVRSPRILSVLAGGIEGPLQEDDLDLRNPEHWTYWTSSVHSTTMGTLALERIAQENPRLSIVHWYPGAVATRGLANAGKYGMKPPNPASQDEFGARAVFLATNDRYAVQGGGLVPVPEGISIAEKSGGGIFLIDPQGESTNNEARLADYRKRGVSEAVWDFTQKIYEIVTANRKAPRDEL